MAGRWTLPWGITVHRAGQLCFSRNTFFANTSERCLWWCDEQWRLAAVFWAPKMSFKISRSTVKILQETWPPSNRRVAASATFVSRQWPFLLLTVNATNPEAFPPQKNYSSEFPAQISPMSQTQRSGRCFSHPMCPGATWTNLRLLWKGPGPPKSISEAF